MKFAGLIKNSFVDYPNEIAAVVFTSGCNFNCWYCHNNSLIDNNPDLEKIGEDEVLKFLEDRKEILDGLVISGGEPTLHTGLKEFIKKVKQIGYKVKLDTNGTNPGCLKELIDENLLDFVAMDIKTTLEAYKEIVGDKCLNLEDIRESINILMKSQIDYEFRTTFAPDVSTKDIENIAKMIAGAKKFIIQKYNPQGSKIAKIPHKYEDFFKAKEIAEQYVSCSLRSLD